MQRGAYTRALSRGILVLVGLLLGAPAAAQTGATETLTFPSIADTYVDSGTANTNYNSAAALRLDASPVRITYLRFAVSGVNGRAVQQARLRLGAAGRSTGSGGTVHLISNGSWNEATVTYATRPAIDGPGLFTCPPVPTVGAVVEFTLDGAIAGDGIYNLAIDTSSTDGMDYNSSLATSGQKPILVLTVAAGPNPAVTILQPLSGANFFTGDAVTLQGTAVDSVGGNLSAAIRWSSSLQGPLGAGASVITSLAPGSHVVTAAVTDSTGLVGSAAVNVTVTAPPAANTAPLVAITAPLDGQAFTAGAPIPFMGTANDLENGVLTPQLVWSSSLQGVLGTGGSFTSALVEGTHTITAAATDPGGLTGSAQLTVTVLPASSNTPPSLLLVAPRDGRTYTLGEVASLVAVAEDREDGLLTRQLSWTDDRDGALGVGGTISRALSLGLHHVTVSVTDAGGLRSTATATVTVLAPTTFTFAATADTYVDASRVNRNYGIATSLLAQGTPVRQAFFRFTVQNVAANTVAQARLRLTVNSGSSDGSPAGGTVYSITSNAWSEATTTYATRPAVDGAALATAGAVKTNQVVDFDVTAAVKGNGTYNFALVSPSTDSVRYRSREAKAGKPQLIISLRSPRVTLTGTTGNGYVNGSLASDTTINASAATFLGSITNSYPLNLGGGPGVWLLGGAVLGQYDRTWTWSQMHSANNAAVNFDNPQFVVDGLRVDDVTDGVRPQNGGVFTVRNVHLSYIRDDCVENDHLHAGLVDDSLFDGCYDAFSARPSPTIVAAGTNGSGNLWRIENTLVRLQPMPGPDGGSIDGYGNAGFFKWDSWDTPSASLSPKLALHNNVFMAERVGQSGASRMGVPPGQLVSCSNNVMVWLGAGDYPAALPSCFTVTKDRTVWDNAVADWLLRHPQVRP